MLLKSLKVVNFGTYRGCCTFELTPRTDGLFERPVVLVQGKNGVGKSTLLEAIRLVLHGSISLGSRVSRREYEEYLAARIHRPAEGGLTPDPTSIRLEFELITSGQALSYVVERSWQRNNGNGITETVSVLENGSRPIELEENQTESFLRELVPESITKLFFFDSERLDSLTKDGSASFALAASVKSLLGLNLVEQLQKDLDVYITRQTSRFGNNELQTQLQHLNERRNILQQELHATATEQSEIEEALSQCHSEIKQQEQNIAHEGGWFASKLDDLRQTRQRLLGEIEAQRRYIQELCSGLVPFAIAPEMCQAVAGQLERERDYERQITANQLLERQLARMSQALSSSEFWQQLALEVDNRTKNEAFGMLEKLMRETTPAFELAEGEVVMHVSERERQTLLDWIARALDETPRQFCMAMNALEMLQQEANQVEHELALVPPDATLSPMVESLHKLYRELAYLQNRQHELEQEARSQNYAIEQLRHELERIHTQLVEHTRSSQRVQLAAKAQLAFSEYSTKLMHEKLQKLEAALVARFNDLCRKESLLDKVEIDLANFEVILGRNGRTFERSELSAGEKQLFAIATIWALRQVSGVHLPVIIDTPLGRLDSEHRLNMVKKYFPLASHQVILLATDSEIEAELMSHLEKSISHLYQLEFAEEQGCTSAFLYTPTYEAV